MQEYQIESLTAVLSIAKSMQSKSQVQWLGLEGPVLWSNTSPRGPKTTHGENSSPRPHPLRGQDTSYLHRSAKPPLNGSHFPSL